MSHPRNTNFERLHAPRTLSDAFGPYATLHVPPKRYNLRGWVAAIGYGIAVGAFLYVVVLIKVGP